MKTHILYLSFLAFSSQVIFAQSIVKTADSKSGVLIGTQKGKDFAGITYDQGSDEMTFNYKVNNKQTTRRGENYPDFKAMNIELGVDLSKNKSPFIKSDKWQGGLQGSITLLKTWDNTEVGTTVIRTETKTFYLRDPGGTVKYETRAECEANGGSCSPQTTTTNVMEPKPVNQLTFFLTFGEEINRINYLQDQTTRNDSVFVLLNDKMQSKTTFTAGLNNLWQLTDNLFLSGAVSFNFNFIDYSGSKYETEDLVSTDKSYFNSKDKTPIKSFSKSKEYIPAAPEFEFQFIPRADFFIRYNLGPKKPYIGVIGSYAPIRSSLGSVATKNNYAIGPSVSLPGLSDQVVFALMSEWQEDLKGETKYSLSFHASFPFVFN